MSDEKKDGLPPFVPNDDFSNMIAARAARRRRARAAVLDLMSGPLMGRVLGGGPLGSAPIGSTPIGGALSAVGALAADTTVLSPWVAVRAEMIPRLDAIEAGLRELAPVIERFEAAYREHARIGHNNPPEDIDILPIELAELELGIVAANLARTELNAEQPRSDVMRFCGLVLRWTGSIGRPARSGSGQRETSLWTRLFRCWLSRRLADWWQSSRYSMVILLRS